MVIGELCDWYVYYLFEMDFSWKFLIEIQNVKRSDSFHQIQKFLSFRIFAKNLFSKIPKFFQEKFNYFLFPKKDSLRDIFQCLFIAHKVRIQKKTNIMKNSILSFSLFLRSNMIFKIFLIFKSINNHKKGIKRVSLFAQNRSSNSKLTITTALIYTMFRPPFKNGFRR